jgi:cyclopropane-fatty-acyl-phospholipid synthase
MEWNRVDYKKILILIIVIFILWKIFIQEHFARYIVNKMLKSFDKRNVVIVDRNKSVLLKVINNKNKPIPTVVVNNTKEFYNKLYANGEIGLGEAYVAGVWDSENLTNFIEFLCFNQNNKYTKMFSKAKIFNLSLESDKNNIVHHYDEGNDFFMKFLTDDLSAYTCGFWFKETDTLNDAQYNKVNTIIKKLNAKSNKKILDVGCGWGKIANYVAKKTMCHVTGLTISDEQDVFIKNNFTNNVNVINMDYRLHNDMYDYIYSIEMFEAVRYENYDHFFKMIKRCLKPSGRFVMHTIISFTMKDTTTRVENFVCKHIFPGGQIPCNDWILDSVRGNGLNVIHFEGYGGQHYAKTLKTWKENLIKEKEYIIKNYSLELFRKYYYYLSACEASFNTGEMGIGHYIIVHDDILSTSNSFNYNL